MLLGLEAHQVVGAEVGHQLARDRHGLEHRGRRERHVQEEAERPAEALLAQHAAERHKVIVVRPHRVVGLQHLAERGGEGLVDREVALVVLAAEMHQAEAEMQQRPQRAVGEADIEGAVRLGREVDRGIGDAARLDQRRLHRRCGGEPAAPAEPHGARRQDIAQGHGEAACGGDAGFWNRHPIRDDHEACHSPSSQLRDRRMADRISPTCE